ncbi:MAG: ATP cone domain-containing protein [Acidobacteriota bacterium]
MRRKERLNPDPNLLGVFTGVTKYSLYVIDGEEQFPFLRGMMTHSLIERGLSFKQAYDAANLVRERLRDKKTVTRRELEKLTSSILKEKYGDRYGQKPEPVVSPSPTILVKGEEAMPFSKGILSQSLQASGLDPSIAYAIAREIEKSLFQEKRLEIERNELRYLIYTTILEKHDPAFAERYLLWRLFKAPDKPVVILFGGATGTGKTSVAHEVGHRLGIPQILSTDTIRQVMRMMFSYDLLPAIHSSSFEAWKGQTAPDIAGGGAVLSAFKEQTLRVLVGVRAIVTRAIEENTSIVIDGVHLVPGLMRFEDLEDQAYVVPVVISTLNRQKYLERFPAREHQAVNRRSRRYRQNFEFILRIQDYILEMAEEHGTPIIENNNLDETVSSILTVITNALGEKLNVNREELVAKTLSTDRPSDHS